MPKPGFQNIPLLATPAALRLARIASRALRTAAALAAGGLTSAIVSAHPNPAAQKVAILIFDDVQVIDYSGPLEVLSSAGFDVFTVAATRNPVTTSAGDAVKLIPKYTFDDAPQADLVVIPGGGFEAAKDSATVAWIQRQSGHAAHTMSVCNGAFTLANTGLLDGLKATTTAGNIQRFRQSHPSIQVVPEQRVVDNGRIITTAGLSAGIDGALHMVDILKGDGAGRSVALAIEYDWRPHAGWVRGTMADRLIPGIYSLLHAQQVADPYDGANVGDKDQWDRALWYTTPQTPAELFQILKGAYETAYARDGGPWAPQSFRLKSAGPLSADLAFKDREGHRWQGVLAVEPQSEAGQVGWRLQIRRAG
jgi:putative intracellular protease/amidase